MQKRRIIYLIALYCAISVGSNAQESVFDDEIESVEVKSNKKAKNVKVIINNWDLDAFSVVQTQPSKEQGVLIEPKEEGKSTSEFNTIQLSETEKQLVKVVFDDEGLFEDIVAQFTINYALHKVLEYEIADSKQKFVLDASYTKAHHFKERKYILFKLEGKNNEIYSKRWLLFQKHKDLYKCSVAYLKKGHYQLSLVMNQNEKLQYSEPMEVKISDYSCITVSKVSNK